jgi:hypothetical protein
MSFTSRSSNTCFLPHGSWCGRVSEPEPLSFKVEWPMVSAEQKLEWILDWNGFNQIGLMFFSHTS